MCDQCVSNCLRIVAVSADIVILLKGSNYVLEKRKQLLRFDFT